MILVSLSRTVCGRNHDMEDKIFYFNCDSCVVNNTCYCEIFPMLCENFIASYFLELCVSDQKSNIHRQQRCHEYDIRFRRRRYWELHKCNRFYFFCNRKVYSVSENQFAIPWPWRQLPEIVSEYCGRYRKAVQRGFWKLHNKWHSRKSYQINWFRTQISLSKGMWYMNAAWKIFNPSLLPRELIATSTYNFLTTFFQNFQKSKLSWDLLEKLLDGNKPFFSATWSFFVNCGNERFDQSM